MLCLPGFTPVAKLAQATGDSDGCVVSSLAKVPVSESFLRLGSLPSSMNLRASVGSMPSKPITNTCCLARRVGLPSDPDRQLVAARPADSDRATKRVMGPERIERF